jgi:hypothetical protein
MTDTCVRCGCETAVHHHYRAGLDCGRCGRDTCPQLKLGSPAFGIRNGMIIVVLGFWLPMIILITWLANQ